MNEIEQKRFQVENQGKNIPAASPIILQNNLPGESVMAPITQVILNEHRKILRVIYEETACIGKEERK